MRPALQFKVSLEPHQLLSLQCITPAVGRLPSSRLVAGPTGTVQVGRALQPLEFWQALVPDEALRNAISRTHFAISPKDTSLLLVNLSVAGTLLNGQMVQQEAEVKDGDMLAIPLHRRPGAPPIVQFRIDCPSLLATTPSSGLAKEAANTRAVASPQKCPNRDSPDVVHVNPGLLPPPFTIHCISACGEPLNYILAASSSEACISVGSDFQDSGFWSAVLKERPHKLAPHYFQLFLSHGASDSHLQLILHVHVATQLNGVKVSDMQPVAHEDLISITEEDEQLLCFRDLGPK